MTLLDAPSYDAARARRRQTIVVGGAGLLVVLFIGAWLISGRPVDWPWYWWSFFRGRATANAFLTAVEKNDLPKAYSLWTHDPDWQKHSDQHAIYSFSRFQQDWGPNSAENDYGAIQSHKIVAARRYGNSLLMAILFNGRKGGALDLDYDPRTHALSFSPPGVELYLGP